MKKYTFYFEIFGLKKKCVCIATDEESAEFKFSEFLRKQTTVNKMEAEPFKPKKNEWPGGNIFDCFNEIFNKDFFKY